MNIDLAIGLGAVAVLSGLVAVGIVRGRRLREALLAVRAALCEELGLRQRTPAGLFPDLEGEVDGQRVRVDVVQLAYRSGSESGGHQRPWTRVRVAALAADQLSIHARQHRYAQAPAWLARRTGDAAFDARYLVYAPPALDLEAAVPDVVRRAFVAADVPVTFSGGQVWWMRIKHVREPELMLAVVRSCVAVARAFECSAGDARDARGFEDLPAGR